MRKLELERFLLELNSNPNPWKPAMSLPHYRQQTSFNLIALLVVIGVNVMANTATLNGLTTGDISNRYPNLFTPANVTFSIWSVIYLGLLGFARLLALAFLHQRAMKRSSAHSSPA